MRIHMLYEYTKEHISCKNTRKTYMHTQNMCVYTCCITTQRMCMLYYTRNVFVVLLHKECACCMTVQRICMLYYYTEYVCCITTHMYVVLLIQKEYAYIYVVRFHTESTPCKITQRMIVLYGEVGGWGRVPFSRNLMSPTPRRKWYLTTGHRAH